jgi:hypothetical protein
VRAIQENGEVAEEGTVIGQLDGQVAIEFDAQCGATSVSILPTVLSVVMSAEGSRGLSPWMDRRSFVESQGFATSTTCALTHR